MHPPPPRPAGGGVGGRPKPFSVSLVWMMMLAKEIDGEGLLNLCMETVYKAQEVVGGRFVLLECRWIDKVVSFYTKQGFAPLQRDETDSYLQMVRRL